jgi:hypothetical protein
MTAQEQLSAERAEIVDDAVVDDRDSTGAIDMWMGVRLGDAAVRRPSGMAETESRHREISSSRGNLSGAFLHGNTAINRNRNTPGIVSAVFERSKSVKNIWPEIAFGSDIAKNSAHEGNLSTRRIHR